MKLLRSGRGVTEHRTTDVIPHRRGTLNALGEEPWDGNYLKVPCSLYLAS